MSEELTWVKALQEHKQKIAQLQAENKRLKEALQELKEFGGVNNDTDAMQIINQALQEKPK